MWCLQFFVVVVVFIVVVFSFIVRLEDYFINKHESHKHIFLFLDKAQER